MTGKRKQHKNSANIQKQGQRVIRDTSNFMLGAATLTAGVGVLGAIGAAFKK